LGTIRQTIVIAPYTVDQVLAVRDFNARLAAANGYGEFQLAEEPPVRQQGRRLAEATFLALDDGAVRGSFTLNSQEFSFRGDVRRVAHYRLPISEGVLSRAYAGVGLQMLRTALKLEPQLFALGMGGTDRALPQMLKAVGWRLYPVPFYFKVIRAQRFLRELRTFQTGALRRAAALGARLSGVGPAGIHAVQWCRQHRSDDVLAEPVRAFDAWADALWERTNYRYAMVAARDAAALNTLYPVADGRFLRLKVTRDGAIAGWAVLLDTGMRGHRQFGDLRVGTIADCLALPEDAGAVVAAATEWLADRGVDLIVTNQAHAAWGRAFERSGFFRGPSNYVFAVSKKLAEALEPFEVNRDEIHINRGDGDGPIHL
jgi:hypothetical protein